VLVPLSKVWRERDLRRRTEVWAPRVGRDAATTFARGRWFALAGIVALWTSVPVCVAFAVSGVGAVPVALSVAIFWPVGLYCLTKGVRLQVHANHQAQEFVGVTGWRGIPIRNVERFDEWRRTMGDSLRTRSDRAERDGPRMRECCSYVKAGVVFRVLKMARMRSRLRQRMASRRLFPSVRLRSR
jgi:hypothetical protein